MPLGNGLPVLQDSQNEKDIDADHSMTETVQLGVALAKTEFRKQNQSSERTVLACCLKYLKFTQDTKKFDIFVSWKNGKRIYCKELQQGYFHYS